ncbi:hypothetical protein [Hyphomicrobium sp.]|jgi:hypothetical protein|uniref:hypothetical protein n=1 Tax=Hyphomicrobium sp. TaxID=82 RepID=UPI002B8A6937|nr:hypothetical protein [Hyphomicrobium sp.]HVZ04503.1 hypothetical protein [Hyphomicrobium sp.]
MANLRLTLCGLVMIALCGSAQADDSVPTHFLCDFDMGYAWSYDSGKFKSEPAKDLSFEIGNIDLEKQSATLIIDGKSANTLKIVRALNANTFLEVVNEGFLNMTTIYDRDPATGKYPAVHSRHFGLFGQPIFAQYAGNCAAKP